MSRAAKPARGRRVPKGGLRRAPKLTKEQIADIDHLHVDALRALVTDRGKLRSRKSTGLNRRDQNRAVRAVKNARELALLPYPHPGMAPLPGAYAADEDEKPTRSKY